INKESLSPGESAEITVSVENTGNASGTFTVELSINGDVADTKKVTVPAGESRTVTFTHTFEETGTYDVVVNNRSVGQVTVERQTPSFSVTDVSLSETSIEQGGSVEVTATVENSGGSEGTFTAELDGETVASKEVTVGAGQSRTVTFTYTFEEAGEFEVGISGKSAGNLTVEERSSSDGDDGSDGSNGGGGNSQGQPGFGLLAALGSIGGAVAYRILRKDETAEK
ncbi:MAG: CARDB domain-containing protein, partial [Halobacteria archaeon]|nr:CARDB domain-containing protein [Halobacteria archaeon]